MSGERVLRFIIDYKRGNDGNSPTIREIAQGLYLGKTTVVYWLHKLEELGEIECVDRARRQIRVRGGAWDVMAEQNGTNER